MYSNYCTPLCSMETDVDELSIGIWVNEFYDNESVVNILRNPGSPEFNIYRDFVTECLPMAINQIYDRRLEALRIQGEYNQFGIKNADDPINLKIFPPRGFPTSGTEFAIPLLSSPKTKAGFKIKHGSMQISPKSESQKYFSCDLIIGSGDKDIIPKSD